MTKAILLSTALMMAPMAVLAKGGDGGDSSEPPAKTATTLECSNGMVAVKGVIGQDDLGFKTVTVQKLLKKVTYEVPETDAAVGQTAEVCVSPSAEMSFNTDEIYNYARELAYDGQYRHALDLLALAPEQDDPRIMTYYGFAYRKLGNAELANEYYLTAIALDSGNIAARSYYGQGLVSMGKTDEAKIQLAAIVAEGGQGTWAHQSLQDVINGKPGYNF